MNMKFFNYNFQNEKWKQYKQQNFYTYYKNNFIILRSYNTIVGVVDLTKNILYRTKTKYSITTSKQLTKYANDFQYNTEYVDNNEIQIFIYLLEF